MLLTPTPYTAPLAGDANLDGKVDVNDLTVVLAHFGRSGMAWNEGDFNGDGRVNVNDLTILLSNFGVDGKRRLAGRRARTVCAGHAVGRRRRSARSLPAETIACGKR